MIPLVVSTSQLISSITLAGYAHKSSGDNVVCMWVQLKRWYVSYVWMLQRENSGDGCVLALKYVVCLCKGCNGCCVFCVYCEA